MNPQVRTPFLAVGALALSASFAGAALTITNGNFNDQTLSEGGTDQNVNLWFDDNGSFSSFEFRSTAQLRETTTLLALGNANGWIYQSLGTRSAGEDRISFTFDARERFDSTNAANNRSFPDTINFQLITGSFSGAADNTDITFGGATGRSLLGTLSVNDEQLFPISPDNGNNAENALGYTTGTLDLTGFAVGTQIWLRVSGSGYQTAEAAYIDNLSANVSAIPEPGSALLGGLGMLALLRRRR